MISSRKTIAIGYAARRTDKDPAKCAYSKPEAAKNNFNSISISQDQLRLQLKALHAVLDNNKTSVGVRSKHPR